MLSLFWTWANLDSRTTQELLLLRDSIGSEMRTTDVLDST
jgi:hypothetical protein